MEVQEAKVQPEFVSIAMRALATMPSEWHVAIRDHLEELALRVQVTANQQGPTSQFYAAAWFIDDGVVSPMGACARSIARLVRLPAAGRMVAFALVEAQKQETPEDAVTAFRGECVAFGWTWSEPSGLIPEWV